MRNTFSKLLQETTTPKTKTNLAVEDLIRRGVFDDRDIDYLDHLHVPDAYDAAATEGIIRAVAHDYGSTYTDSFREIKGWFLGIESKRKYIEEICTDLIDWLKDKEINYRDLDLDMGSFKTWMKTSETFFWRYYFILNNEMWKKIEADLKSGNITDLESIYSVDFTKRRETAQELDSITDIKGLIKVVETYQERSNKFFELILKRKVKIKMAPFQVILLGSTDLRRTTKKIVNLAI